jgi:hypothetical protein
MIVADTEKREAGGAKDVFCFEFPDEIDFPKII